MFTLDTHLHKIKAAPTAQCMCQTPPPPRLLNTYYRPATYIETSGIRCDPEREAWRRYSWIPTEKSF